jgi:hypothetical protein
MGRKDNFSKEERKQARAEKKIERKEKTKKELERIILACEGTVTEKDYFESIFKELMDIKGISKTSLVIAKHAHTNPKGVLHDLEMELEKDDEFEYKWIVIDRDEMRVNGGGHSLEDFNAAISSAKAQGINVAYSNPSFEIWYLLHFEYRNTGIDRDEVIVKLNRYIDYVKNSKKIFFEIKEKQIDAIGFSKRLEAEYRTGGRELNPAMDNPSSTVYQLVEQLNKFKDLSEQK